MDCAFDGQEALEQLDGERYDLILLDVMLPQMDGFELMDKSEITGIVYEPCTIGM